MNKKEFTSKIRTWYCRQSRYDIWFPTKNSINLPLDESIDTHFLMLEEGYLLKDVITLVKADCIASIKRENYDKMKEKLKEDRRVVLAAEKKYAADVAAAFAKLIPVDLARNGIITCWISK